MIRSLLKFIRLPNLIIVGITQYVLLYCLLLPYLHSENILPVLDHLHFFLFALVTVIITLSGNIINDIEDYEIDRINRPETVFVSKYISVSSAWKLYAIVIFIGLLLALYLAFYVDKLLLTLIYPAAVLLLYSYSRTFKKLPAIGNIIVSIFCGGVAGIVLFAERDAFNSLSEESAYKVFLAFGAYAIFAFFTTLYREIIKDLEDMEGDRERGCNTLPIFLGEKNTQRIAFFIGLSLVAIITSITHLFFKFSFHIILSLFNIVFIILPMIYLLYRNFAAQSKSDYHFISTMMKGIMLSGLLFLPLFYFYNS